MNKSELVSAIAKKTGQSATAVGEMLSAFEGVITEAVVSGDKVQLAGFLTFDKTVRAARSGRNPATGETIQIPQANVPRVKVGKSLKDAVNA